MSVLHGSHWTAETLPGRSRRPRPLRAPRASLGLAVGRALSLVLELRVSETDTLRPSPGPRAGAGGRTDGAGGREAAGGAWEASRPVSEGAAAGTGGLRAAGASPSGGPGGGVGRGLQGGHRLAGHRHALSFLTCDIPRAPVPEKPRLRSSQTLTRRELLAPGLLPPVRKGAGARSGVENAGHSGEHSQSP